MPRQPRLLLQGVPLHLIQRGHNREACFFREADFQIYLNMLRDHSQRTQCHVHAYVLMTNHVHLLVSFNDIRRAPQLIKLLGQHYAQYLNRHRARCGTLWDGRYRSSPALSERYFLICQRYIELNPVRAGMVAEPAAYRWSSYRGNAGLTRDTLLTPHELYTGLAPAPAARAEAYRALFEEAITEEQKQILRRAANANGAVTTPDEAGVCPFGD